jgi:hypothetical protein
MICGGVTIVPSGRSRDTSLYGTFNRQRVTRGSTLSAFAHALGFRPAAKVPRGGFSVQVARMS